MKTALWLCVFWMSVALNVVTAQQQQPTASAQHKVIVVRAGTLIDGKSDTPRSNQMIVIRDNRIESVGDAANANVPAGATVVDLSRDTVLPGLIDSHTHI